MASRCRSKSVPIDLRSTAQTKVARDVEGTFELFLYRLSGAAVLDSGIYESIEADPHATKQAVAVVLLSAVASGIGASGLVGPHSLVLTAISALALVT